MRKIHCDDVRICWINDKSIGFARIHAWETLCRLALGEWEEKMHEKLSSTEIQLNLKCFTNYEEHITHLETLKMYIENTRAHTSSTNAFLYVRPTTPFIHRECTGILINTSRRRHKRKCNERYGAAILFLQFMHTINKQLTASENSLWNKWVWRMMFVRVRFLCQFIWIVCSILKLLDFVWHSFSDVRCTFCFF